MFEIAAPLVARLDAGQRVAIATVTRVVGSAPRDLGTSMAVDEFGSVIGSISGGCVEGAVFELASRVLDSGVAEYASFGIDDEMAYSVGLTCGGQIEVFVRELESQLSSELNQLRAASRGLSAGSAVVIVGPPAVLGISSDELTDARLAAAGIQGLTSNRVHDTVAGHLAAGFTGRVAVQCEGAELELFVESRLAPPRMLIFGAVDFARALSDAAQLLGYRVTVCDAREAFATPERFPGAEVVVEWPDAYLAAATLHETQLETARLESAEPDNDGLDDRSVIAVLTHDARFDIPLLLAALALPVAYVGAMGSRRTHNRRMAALRGAGVSDAALARLHSPIGLDLGASTPQETAISILAEIIRARSGSSATPLSALDGPIHQSPPRGS